MLVGFSGLHRSKITRFLARETDYSNAWIRLKDLHPQNVPFGASPQPHDV
jgi:hypothetical protein